VRGAPLGEIIGQWKREWTNSCMGRATIRDGIRCHGEVLPSCLATSISGCCIDRHYRLGGPIGLRVFQAGSVGILKLGFPLELALNIWKAGVAIRQLIKD
jgi:hypothetical protein